ncbi:MAG: polyprenyl synthetase family protein [Anaerolineae bacterium]|nr:polyprenyl synthetase family protein [Anaerolineae bacterium]
MIETMIEAVEAEMQAVLASEPSVDDTFFAMLQYHMGWVEADHTPIGKGQAGKRIRPLLCLLSCAAAGGEWQKAVPAAAAAELLHSFSLIHDDIQDQSPTRRGKPTVWKIWGAPQAINSGDAMLAYAHIAMSRLFERGVAPDVVVRALRRLDETCIELTKGQYADMSFEQRDDVTLDEYMQMIKRKTSVLVELCAELGALVAGQDEVTIQHFGQFGLNLGLAFQVKDDILGIWGDEAVIGKSAATDIETRKKTLPVLYGLARHDGLRTLYQQPTNQNGFVPQVITCLNEVGAREYAEKEAAAYSHNALHHLEAAAPTSEGYKTLYDLALKLLNRMA